MTSRAMLKTLKLRGSSLSLSLSVMQIKMTKGTKNVRGEKVSWPISFFCFVFPSPFFTSVSCPSMAKNEVRAGRYLQLKPQCPHLVYMMTTLKRYSSCLMKWSNSHHYYEYHQDGRGDDWEIKDRFTSVPQIYNLEQWGHEFLISIQPIQGFRIPLHRAKE